MHRYFPGTEEKPGDYYNLDFIPENAAGSDCSLMRQPPQRNRDTWSNEAAVSQSPPPCHKFSLLVLHWDLPLSQNLQKINGVPPKVMTFLPELPPP